MTDDEWEEQRNRAISIAFQTGRPVMADREGGLRYADDGTSVDGPATPVQGTTEGRSAERASWMYRAKTHAVSWWEAFKNWALGHKR